MIREDLVRRLAGGEKPFDYDIDRIFDHYVSLDKKRPRIFPVKIRYFDLDAKGNLCSITVEHASTRTDAPQFSYEQVAA